MMMISTIKPYGSVNIEEVHYIIETPKGFFIKDKYGYWKVDEHTFIQLQKKGIRKL